jgi:hypothetical protein
MRVRRERVREMDARRGLHRTRAAVLLGMFLVIPVACDGDGSSRPAGTPRPHTAAPTKTTADDVEARPTAPTTPVACPSEPRRSWTTSCGASRDLTGPGELADVVVSRTGTATVAWTGLRAPLFIRTSDEPPAPGDPQDPPDPDPPTPPYGHDPGEYPVSSMFNGLGGDALGIDSAGVQTALWQQDVFVPDGSTGTSGGTTENYDVVLSDRPPGGGWSSSPSVVGTGYVGESQLAVNASGAAVVAWSKSGNEKNSGWYASYRDAADAGWTPAKRLPHAGSLSQVGIDDVGRVLLLYSSGSNGATKAIRRSAAGRWGKPQNVGGADSMAVGAGGAAMVGYSRTTDRTSPSQQFTQRMSPSGHWDAPVRQPDGIPVTFPGNRQGAVVDMDAKGRALFAWWDGSDLMIRWSRPDGRWRRPCVLAQVSKPRGILAAELAVNRRGDALVVWPAKDEVAQLWARYRPAGQGWTKPVEVMRADRLPETFIIAIGDRGHTAIAWTPRRNDHQIQVLRTSPRRDLDRGQASKH